MMSKSFNQWQYFLATGSQIKINEAPYHNKSFNQWQYF